MRRTVLLCFFAVAAFLEPANVSQATERQGHELHVWVLEGNRSIESRVSTSPSFKLGVKETQTKRGRPHKMGLDYFIEKKFYHADVAQKVREVFGEGDYARILVVYDFQDNAVLEFAKSKGTQIWLISTILANFIIRQVDLPSRKHGLPRGYRDDVMRTIELVVSAMTKGKPRKETKAEIDFDRLLTDFRKRRAETETLGAIKRLEGGPSMMIHALTTIDRLFLYPSGMRSCRVNGGFIIPT